MSAVEILPAPVVRGIGGSSRVSEILRRARAGERLGHAEALSLLEDATLLELGDAAFEARVRHNGDRVVTYQIDRNINYTNVCVYRCAFCAFYRKKGDSDTYVLSHEEIGRKVEETLALGGTGVLLQGGINGDLPFSFYEEMLGFLKEKYPAIHRHCFSAPEIWFLAKREKLPVREVLTRLAAAGLMSVPGGGAEVLDDDVRKRIVALTKAPTARWAEVHAEAHRIGLPTTATMMFGVGETYAQRVNHLDVVRRVQDEAISEEKPERFTSFIPWTFQEENTDLDGKVETAGGHEYLRLLALSRLYLDNIRHVQGSWLTQGTKIGQTSILFGADDLGSIMIEENVVAAAGSHNRTSVAELTRLIEDAGFSAKQRGSVYDRCHAPCCAALNEA